MLIKADAEDHAPTRTEAGLYLATSLAAAVDGEDPGESWFVGTIVQIGPMVNRLDVRSRVLRWMREMCDELGEYEDDRLGEGRLMVPSAEILALRRRIEDLPAEQPDPLKVGDRVTFSWAAGQEIAVEGSMYLILRAGDVLAVLENE